MVHCVIRRGLRTPKYLFQEALVPSVARSVAGYASLHKLSQVFPSFSKRAGAQAGLRKEGFFGAPSGAGVRVGADVRLSVRARGRGCQAAGFSLCRGSVRTADGVTWH